MRDLAALVGRLTGTPLAELPNPRNEAAENDLAVRNDQFLALGLEPTTLAEGLLVEVVEVARHHLPAPDRPRAHPQHLGLDARDRRAAARRRRRAEIDAAAYVTLVTDEEYGLGALALARSLRLAGARLLLVVLATAGAGRLGELEVEGCEVVRVEPLPLSPAFRERHIRPALHAAAPFAKGGKPAFHDPLDNFAKLRLWELVRFRKMVFLDADTLVVRNIDRLFDCPAFSAAPNVYAGLADFHRMNSGVFVAEPSAATFDAMLARLDAPDAFWRRTDQTFLETFWPDWHGLPHVYNVLQYVYCDLPELWCWPQSRVVHYQYEKPWVSGDVQNPSGDAVRNPATPA